MSVNLVLVFYKDNVREHCDKSFERAALRCSCEANMIHRKQEKTKLKAKQQLGMMDGGYY